MRRVLAAIGLFAGLAACRDLTDAQAVKLVETYNGRVIEAFRTGDAKLIEPVTGPTDGKRLTGLIGVKSDMGITLDAKLLEFKVVGVERRGGEVVVRSEERWHYRDRRIGSGAQVGEASDDHYFMRYELRKRDGRYVVDEIAFERPPEVGRKEAPVSMDVRAAHGLDAAAPEAPPAGAPPRSPGAGAEK